MATDPEELWVPQRRAANAQRLLERRLTQIRERMAPESFRRWAMSLDLVLEPLIDLLEGKVAERHE